MLHKIIIKYILNTFNVSLKNLQSKSKKDGLPRIRQYMSYFLSNYTQLENKEIATLTGWGIKHANNSVSYANSVISDLHYVNSNLIDERFIYIERCIKNYISGKDKPEQVNEEMIASLVEIEIMCNELQARVKTIKTICNKYKKL